MQHLILKIHLYSSVWISCGRARDDMTSASHYREQPSKLTWKPSTSHSYVCLLCYYTTLKIWCPQISYIDSIAPWKVYGKCCLCPWTCFLVCGVRFAIGVQSNPGSLTQPLSEMQKCHDHQAHMSLVVNCNSNVVFMWLLAAVLDTEIYYIDHHKTLSNWDIT